MFRVKLRSPRLIRVSVVAACTVEKPSNQKLSPGEVRLEVDSLGVQEAEVFPVISPCHLDSTAGLLHLPPLAGRTRIIPIEEHPQKEKRNVIVLTGGNIRGPRMLNIALSENIRLPPIQMMERKAHTV